MNTTTTYRQAPTQTVDVGGARFAYRKLGAQTGVPAIFLRHFGTNLDDWDAFQYHEEFVPEVPKLLGPSMPTTVPNGSLVSGLDAGAPA